MALAAVRIPVGRGFIVRGAAAAGLILVGLAALVWALSYGGSTEPGRLDRMGPVALWVLPIAKMVFNVAAACTIGGLVLAIFGLSPHEPARGRALRFAGFSAAVWAVVACIATMTTFQIIANLPLLGDGFLDGFLTFLGTDGPGRSGAFSIVIAGVVSVLGFLVQSMRAIILTVLLAFSGLVPLVLNSHATGGADHADSTGAVVLHIGAAAVWLGGLVTLIWIRSSLSNDRLPVVVRRYSTLALLSFVTLVSSGLLAAMAAIESVPGLSTPYGAIVLWKVAAVLILGSIGAMHRRWVIKGLEQDPERAGRKFVLLAVVELAVMGAASGLAAALARTETPSSLGSAATEAVLPAPELSSLITQWQFDPLWSLFSAVALFLYLAGVHRIRHGGGYWPAHRIVLWLAGITTLFTVTNGGLQVYQGYLFNAHVLTQMLLTAVVPLFLVAAAPISLGLRAIHPRDDGSIGGLEVVRSVVQPVIRTSASAFYIPLFVLAGSLVVIYYTPLLASAAVTQLGYITMSVLALLAGCLFVASLIAVTEGRAQRPPHGWLGTIVGAGILYAVYGQALIRQAAEMERPWYTTVGTPWGQASLTGAELGGPTMWIIAGVTLTTLTAILIHRKRTSSTYAAKERPGLQALSGHHLLP